MSDRIRRPPIDRTDPVRNWTTLFTAPAGGGGAHNGGADGHGRQSEADDPSRPGGGRRVEDVVARSVGLGYRVIDEYIQQGQQAARGFGDRSYGAAGMTADAQAVATRMAQYATEMTSLWFEFAGLAAGGMGGLGGMPMGMRPGAPAPPPEPTPAPVPEGTPLPSVVPGPTATRLLVASARPTEVALDLRLEGVAGAITAQALRSPSGSGPRIDDVTADVGADGVVIVRILVPDRQPAGTYEGALVEPTTGRTVGWIAVRVE